MRAASGASAAVDLRLGAAPATAPPRAGTVQALARQALLAHLGPVDLAAIADASRTRSWKAGAALYRRGDASRELILIVRGQVRLSVGSAGGAVLSLRHAGAGSMIGEVGVLGGGERREDSTAIADVAAITLLRAEVHRLVAQRPAIAQALIASLCERASATADQLESIALYGVEARLARLLLRLATPMGAASAVSTIDLTLTQAEIADLIGASRPKVNKAFAQLEASRAIRRSGRRILCDIGRLSARAETA